MSDEHAVYLLPLGANAERSRFVDVLAGVIALLTFAAMLPFAALNSPFWATMFIGTGSFVGLSAAVYVKYRKRVVLNLEVGFILGTMLQYLAAPVMARLLTDDFQIYAGISGDRYAVKDVYGQAMLVVTLFVAAYLLVSALFPVRFAARRADDRLEVAYSHKTFVVMTVMAIMLWMTRAALLASGSYYHLNRSRFQFEDARFSSWTQFDSGIGPIVLAFLWGAYFIKKLPIWFVLAYTLVDFGWNFASGSRERTIIIGIVVLLSYIIYRNRIPWKLLLLSVVPLMFMVGFMDFYRYAVRNTEQNNSIELSGVMTAFSVASRQSTAAGWSNTILAGVNRLNDLESVAGVYVWTPSVQPFLFGETYERIPAAMIPRALWPNKPITITPINEWFFRHEGGSSPLTTMGEGYLNFGWIGVALAGAAAALLVRLSESFLLRYMWNIAILPVYVGTLAIVSRQHTQAMAVWIPTVVKMMFLAWLVHILTRPHIAPEEMAVHEPHPDDGQGQHVPAY